MRPLLRPLQQQQTDTDALKLDSSVLVVAELYAEPAVVAIDQRAIERLTNQRLRPTRRTMMMPTAVVPGHHLNGANGSGDSR